MPSHSDHVARIRAMGRDDLHALLARVRAGRTPGWPAGRAFEYLVLRAFELDGATVRWPFTVSMADETVEQIDGAVYAANLSCIVETKDTVAPIDIIALAKMRTQLARRPAATVGLVISKSGFTNAATTLAGYFAPQTVLLIAGDELDEAMATGGMVAMLMAKYRECVEEGGTQTLKGSRRLR
ncbi:MAG TPA: restriction endonuclease [Longimicrobium sp.]